MYTLNTLQKFSQEEFFYSLDGYFKINLYLPKDTVSLRIRNASFYSYINDFKFISQKFIKKDLLCNKFNLNFQNNFFIYTSQKTMSISVEKYLNKINNNFFVARTHSLNPMLYMQKKIIIQLSLIIFLI